MRVLGSKSLRAREGWRLPEAQPAVAFGGEEGVAERQEGLPAEQGEDEERKGCSGKSQVKDLARHPGLGQVERVLAFLLSRCSGDFIWEKQSLKNIGELMGLQHGRFNTRESTNFASGTKIEQLLRAERKCWSSSVDLLPLVFAFSNRKEASTN